MLNKKLCLVFLSFLISNPLFSQELVIGDERVEPGIKIIFEGAIKDIVYPKSINLNEGLTNVHIEARVNWDFIDVPEGTPKGGFVPYMKITATVTNRKTGLKTFIDLIPHINLVDNFHYARNIALPGKIDDFYDVEFNVNPPGQYELSLHKDWVDTFSKVLFDKKNFSYEKISFFEIAKATRR
tara:strand:+ start:247 stop:795 length:549 start_codon:yes stop_codon:yes gene_type:complete